MSKQDLRVVKTKKNIRQSFIRLLECKEFSSLTVQDILDEALINRTTFYKYYASKYELARQLSDEILVRFALLLDFSLQNRQDTDFFFKNMDKMVEEFYADRQAVLYLWQIKAEGIDLYGDMERLMKQKFTDFLCFQADSEDNLDFQATLFVAMILTTFKYLLESSEKYSPRDLNKQAVKFISKNILENS